MNRIFLSHSSKDKNYVEYIANKFGKDIAFYDKYSFESGMQTFQEILMSLSNSDLFVIFLSDSALKSNWVQQELNIAYDLIKTEKMKQCYPIIIDANINYTDSRIPNWLKEGYEAYNLRFINSPKIAYRKIKNYLALLNEETINQNYKIYIGHDDLSKRFDEQYYTSEHSYKGIIACGIEGIGRESFIRKSIKVPRTFGNYYEPIVISLDRNDSIDDVISKLLDNGFGEYSGNPVSYVSKLCLEEKIKILEWCLSQTQDLKEFVIFRDSNVLIQNGEIVWWFIKATEKIREELTFGIVSSQRVHKDFKTAAYYIEEISELDSSDKLKLLDKLSKENNLILDIEDVKFFKQILTGHPLQIQYCIQKIQSESMQEIKKKPCEIVSFLTESTTRMLDKYLELLNFQEEKKNKFLSYLSFVSSYSNIPISEIIEINKLDEEYKDFYNLLIKFCICRRTGMNNDLLTTSSSVVDYIERSRIRIPVDIAEYLSMEYQKFKNCLYKDNLDDYCYSQIAKNLGELVKDAYTNDFKYIYPSIILKSVIQLYNKQSYDKVINICEKCIESTESWDPYIRQTFYFYYAMSTAKKKDKKIFEIIFTKQNNQFILEKFQSDFIRGFYYKLIGKFKQAEEQFQSCLIENNSYFRARRELVETYILLEEYDEALELAEKNYKRFPDNIFNIFQFFKCLIKQKNLKIEIIEKLLEKGKEIDRLPTTAKQFYPNMRAYYKLYVEHNYYEALRIMIENESLFDNKIYYYRDIFDIYAEIGNLEEMGKTYEILHSLVDKDISFLPLLLKRECILNYFNNNDINRVYRIINTSSVDNSLKEKIQKSLLVYIEKH